MSKAQAQTRYTREQRSAKAAVETLAQYVVDDKAMTMRVGDPGNSEEITISPQTLAVLVQALNAAAEGSGVTLIRESEELTTAQAARLLNISRPFLIKLLDEGKMPYRKVGSHRRITSTDLLAYKSAERKRQDGLLEFLTREAQEMGTYE